MNSEQIASIFVRLQSRLRAVGTSILGRSDAVDDALQDTFCRIWTRPSHHIAEDSAEAYIMTSMRNVCIDTQRRQGKSNTLTDDLPDTDEDDCVQDIYDDVMRIVNRELSPVQRRILHLRDVDGADYATIAEIMGMEQPAVRVALSRARKTVRTIYLSRL